MMGPAGGLQRFIKRIRAFADHFHWLLAIGYWLFSG
jgi:hypothetical protein